jgi:hypothetical protein
LPSPLRPWQTAHDASYSLLPGSAFVVAATALVDTSAPTSSEHTWMLFILTSA